MNGEKNFGKLELHDTIEHVLIVKLLLTADKKKGLQHAYAGSYSLLKLPECKLHTNFPMRNFHTKVYYVSQLNACKNIIILY